MATESRGDRPWHRGLTRRSIAEAALEGGLEQLTLATVAERLEVSHAALYRHFTNRDDLVLAVMDLIAEQVEWPAPTDDWTHYLRRLGEQLVTSFVEHPALVAEARRLGPPPTIVAKIDQSFVALCEAGLGEEDAALALTLLSALVDWAAVSAPLSSPPILEHVRSDGPPQPVAFDAQLDVLIAGLRVRIERSE
ncbi:MAG: TetR/AcrR family transcriptional regulator [Actinomycetota bacterium]